MAPPIPARADVVPQRKHDDQIDSTAQMLDWFKQAAREPGFIGYYRMLAEELRQKQGEQPRLKPLTGIHLLRDRHRSPTHCARLPARHFGRLRRCVTDEEMRYCAIGTHQSDAGFGA
jgi:hypothetical protein